MSHISPDAIFNNIVNNIHSRLNLSRLPNNPVNLPAMRNNTSFRGSDSVGGTSNFESVLDTQVRNTSNVFRTIHTDAAINEIINSAILEASEIYDIDTSMIRAIIRTESSYNPNAVSRAGAMGLMQLMPGTAASLGVTDPFDIHQNIMGGTRYFRRMLDRFDNDERLALAAYNAGAGNVQRHGGIPPFPETQNYVPRVLAYRLHYASTMD